MKKRLIAYLLFLPIILLMAFTPVVKYLHFLGWGAVVAAFILIVYAFVKTRAFYKAKKVLLFTFLTFAFSILAQPLKAQMYGSDPFGMYDPSNPNYYVFGAGAYGNSVPASYSQQKKCSNIKEQISSLRNVFGTIGRIPESQRTDTQKKEYNDAKTKFEKLMKDCHIQQCPTPKELYEEISADCWSCDIANLFIEAGDKVATSFYTVISKNGYALTLLALGLFFWLITRTFTLIMSMGVGDIGRYFTDLFNKFLLVGGIAILLTFPIRNTVDFVVTPFFLFSATMTQQMQKISTNMQSYGKMTKIDELMSDQFGKALECKYCEDLENNVQELPDEKIRKAIKYEASLSERVVSPTMRNALLCTVCSIYQVTVPPTVVGQFLYCSAKQLKADGSELGKEEIYRDWDSVIVGFFLTLTFFLISALFSFYLIDTFFRICIVLILFPFLVVAFAFKSTRHYTKKGLDVLIHSTVTYIIIALFMTLTIQIFYTMLGDISGKIVDALADKDNAYTQLKELLTFSSKNGAWVMFSCIGLVFIVLFILRQLDTYITAITGINLSNGGGGGALMSSVGAAMAVKETASDLYDQEWKNPAKNSDNNPESKAAKIRAYGENESDGKAEKGVDYAANTTEKGINAAGNTAANGVDKVGTQASNSLMKSGAKMCTAGYGLGAIIGIPMMIAGAALWVATKATKIAIKIATKVAAKVSKAAVKYGGRAVVKAAKWPVKAIARNKYFNKTVGLFWQMGSDVKNAPRNIRNKARAGRKYLKDRFGRKK